MKAWRRNAFAPSLLTAWLLAIAGTVAKADSVDSAAIDSPAILSDPVATGAAYLTVFYPRWFSSLQSLAAMSNQLIGPDVVDPQFRSVVAVNNDTLYSTAWLDVSQEPVVFTIPATPNVYSILLLDQYGQSLPSIPARQPGIYALATPNWTGTLPPGVVRINTDNPRPQIIFRVDKYNAAGQDQQDSGRAFRAGIHAASLPDYLKNAAAGATNIRPDILFGISFKLIADATLTHCDLATTLGEIVPLRAELASSKNQPMSIAEKALANRFNAYVDNPLTLAKAIAGVQKGYDTPGPVNTI